MVWFRESKYRVLEASIILTQHPKFITHLSVKMESRLVVASDWNREDLRREETPS